MEVSDLKTKNFAPLLEEESKLFCYYLAAEAGELGFSASQQLENKIKVDEKLFGKNSVQVANDLKVLSKDYLAERELDKSTVAETHANDIMQKVHRDELNELKLPTPLLAPGVNNPRLVAAIQDTNMFNAYIGRKAAGLLNPQIIDEFINIKISDDKAIFGESSRAVAQDYFAQAKSKVMLGQYGQAGDAMAKCAQIRLHKAELLSGKPELLACPDYKAEHQFTLSMGARSAKAAAKYYMKADNYNKAEPSFRQAIAGYAEEAKRYGENQSDMAPAEARINLGHCLLKEGKTAEGVKEFNKGLEQAKRFVGGNIIPRYFMPAIPEFVAAQRSIGKMQDAKELEDLYKSEVARYGSSSPLSGRSIYE